MDRECRAGEVECASITNSGHPELGAVARRAQEGIHEGEYHGRGHFTVRSTGRCAGHEQTAISALDIVSRGSGCYILIFEPGKLHRADFVLGRHVRWYARLLNSKHVLPVRLTCSATECSESASAIGDARRRACFGAHEDSSTTCNEMDTISRTNNKTVNSRRGPH